MSQINNDISVAVSGGDEETRQVVVAVVGEALENAGFTNTAYLDDKGEPGVFPEKERMIDLLLERNPNLFDTNVAVYAVTDFEDDVANIDAELTADVDIIDPTGVLVDE